MVGPALEEGKPHREVYSGDHTVRHVRQGWRRTGSSTFRPSVAQQEQVVERLAALQVDRMECRMGWAVGKVSIQVLHAEADHMDTGRLDSMDIEELIEVVA